MTTYNSSPMNDLSIVATLVDAALAFVRGRRKTGVVLLAAAALGSRIPGIGTAASILLRLVRRFR